MRVPVIRYKDTSGFRYKYPGRSCKKCLKYPCLKEMDKLKSNFAAYGCTMYSDENTFESCQNK